MKARQNAAPYLRADAITATEPVEWTRNDKDKTDVSALKHYSVTMFQSIDYRALMMKPISLFGLVDYLNGMFPSHTQSVEQYVGLVSEAECFLYR
ncbi:hypothetical protein AVEN_56805-1 [Araneus ventricosus]|uniref:Uncharacterized protein n=1 Tax=Araneus ventricosus TaxID=182803 RepID=A0A4Y2KAF4_ARAVE|nr:hypothetical protein AVEN_56805-1 [Araneus ventricosus]